MDSVSLALVLTPHGRLILTPDSDAPALDAALARRIRDAFERGPGHGLLRLGADEIGTALPPVYSYWREFGARYVTALCSLPDLETVREKVHAPHPADEELERTARAAPPMVGAEYLTGAILGTLWQEMDASLGVELSESKCGLKE